MQLVELMPFLLAQIHAKASSHLAEGMWLFSKSVPTVTLNFFRHFLHLYMPGFMGFLVPGLDFIA